MDRSIALLLAGILGGTAPLAALSLPDDLVALPAGEYLQGSDRQDEGAADERPARTVTLSPFRISRTEVTWADWQEVRDWAVANGYPDLAGTGFGKGPNHPVVGVSWTAAVLWCNAASERDGLVPVYRATPGGAVLRSGGVELTSAHLLGSNGYRLPTEAEWEAAARGGVAGRRFPWGETVDQTRANYFSSGAEPYDLAEQPGQPNPAHTGLGWPMTAPVGSHPENAYGLADIAGNVLEWVWDRYDARAYAAGNAANPLGPDSGNLRVLRGGGWYLPAGFARITRRDADRADSAHHGFRVAQTITAGGPDLQLVEGPRGRRTDEGETVALVAVATGNGGVTYEWTRDGVTIPGANGPQLVIGAGSPGDTGVYRVIVRQGGTSVVSAPVVVSIGGYRTLATWTLDAGFGEADPTADRLGDGVPDLLRFALGLDPAVPEPATERWLQFALRTGAELGLTDNAGTYAVLSFPVDVMALGIERVAEAAVSPDGADSVPLVRHAEKDIDGRRWWIFRSATALAPEAAAQFYRLRVELSSGAN